MAQQRGKTPKCGNCGSKYKAADEGLHSRDNCRIKQKPLDDKAISLAIPDKNLVSAQNTLWCLFCNLYFGTKDRWTAQEKFLHVLACRDSSTMRVGRKQMGKCPVTGDDSALAPTQGAHGGVGTDTSGGDSHGGTGTCRHKCLSYAHSLLSFPVLV